MGTEEHGPRALEPTHVVAPQNQQGLVANTSASWTREHFTPQQRLHWSTKLTLQKIAVAGLLQYTILA